MTPTRTFVTGGTGLIGKKLVPHLVGEGHRVILLSRDPSRLPAQSGVELVRGDATEAGPWLDRLGECDASVHLAGAGLFDRRWSSNYKAAIRESRVKSTGLIANQLAKTPRTSSGQPKVFLSGSAIGFYGSRVDDIEDDESSPAGSDFLANVCVDWEAATKPAEEVGCRVIHFRTGIVLDPSGGALPQMARPFKWFVGGVVASGKQWLSWIHIDDIVRLMAFALMDDRVRGPLNATAPEPMKNWGFCKTLGKVLRRPCWLPTPGWVIRIVVGQAAQVVTRGQRVKPRKAETLGFHFDHPDLEESLRHLYNRPAPPDGERSDP